MCSNAFAEHIPIYVHTYFIRRPAAEYAVQKRDGNLTRLSPPEWESGLRDYVYGVLSLKCIPTAIQFNAWKTPSYSVM